MDKSHRELAEERKSILAVDDEEPMRRLLETYLSDDYTCYCAVSADEALSILEAHTFDLLLTDITMPGMSGIGLCQLVRQTYPEMRIVIISGMYDVNTRIEAMRQGACDYILKPFDLAQLSKAVERALCLSYSQLETERLNGLAHYLEEENKRLNNWVGSIQFIRSICGVLAHDP